MEPESTERQLIKNPEPKCLGLARCSPSQIPSRTPRPSNQLGLTSQPGEVFQTSQMCPSRSSCRFQMGPGCSALIPVKAPPGLTRWIKSSPAKDNSKIPLNLNAVSILGWNSFPIPVIKHGELEQSLSASSSGYQYPLVFVSRKDQGLP